jgi:photosystem II stability/assembly factor-like uncharacterized protein
VLFSLNSCQDELAVIKSPLPPKAPDQIGTWDFVEFLGEDDITSIAVVEDKPWIVYVGFSSDFSSQTLGKIMRTEDWGKTWLAVAEGISVSEIVIDPKRDSVLYATLNSANAGTPGIIKTTDAGDTWFRSDSGLSLDWETSVDPFAIDPSNSRTLYAGIVGIFGGGLVKSTDAGATWFLTPKVFYRPLAQGVTSIAIDPKNSNEIYVGVAGNGFLYKSYDFAETFDVLYDTTVGLPVMLEVDRYSTNVVYVGYRDGGYRRSTDHGNTWKPDQGGLPASSADVLVSGSDSVLFLCAYWGDTIGGVYESSDKGVTWHQISSEPVTTIAIDRANGFLYAAVRRLPSAGLYRYKIVQ